MKHVVEEKMKVGKFGLLIAFLIAGLAIFLLANGRHIAETVTTHQVKAPVVVAPTPLVYVMTNTITMTDRWSEPPVPVRDDQGLFFTTTEGYATEYEVRDADHPEKTYKFHHGENVHTDNVRFHKWQWRVSGQVISGPNVLKCLIYQ